MKKTLLEKMEEILIEKNLHFVKGEKQYYKRKLVEDGAPNIEVHAGHRWENKITVFCFFQTGILTWQKTPSGYGGFDHWTPMAKDEIWQCFFKTIKSKDYYIETP